MTGPPPRVPGALRESVLALPGTTNLRDLAGYPGADGRVVGAGRLLRSEVLAEPGGGEFQGVFDDEDAAAFDALGVHTVIDLRAEHEAERTPSAWQRATGADVLALPIAEGGEGSDTNYVRRLLDGEVTSFGVADMTQFYCDTLDRRAVTFADAVAVLADPRRTPVLVHCSAGKDRTGLLVALVLEVLGTPRALVVEDYALTGVLRPDRVSAYAAMFTEAGIDPQNARTLFETPAESMEQALAHLDATYGGAARYLVEAGGLDPELIARLRDTLLVDPADVPR